MWNQNNFWDERVTLWEMINDGIKYYSDKKDRLEKHVKDDHLDIQQIEQLLTVVTARSLLVISYHFLIM